MLTLNDGRAELWQWDTGRTLAVDSDCSQVHFSNKVFGRSIDVDVVDGVAIIPDVLLQTDKDLNVWAFVGTAENGYTKISKTFKVNRRNKPADYVFTPVEQTTIAEIYAIAQSVRDDADAGLFDGKPGENGRDGVDGKDGAPGKDGTSATHSWNGTVLTITSASGTSSSDLKGDKGDKGNTGPAGKDGTPGADGKTPEYGVDYGTPEQIAGIAQSAAEILQPELNQIKDDISRKQDAPEASGTAGQILCLDDALKPAWADAEKEFRLLLSITLEDDVAQIELTEEQDGTPLFCKDVAIFIIKPAGSALSWRPYYRSTSGVINYSSHINCSAPSTHSLSRLIDYHGRSILMNAESLYDDSGTTTIKTNARDVPSDICRRIQLLTDGVNIFRVGTKIKIYGVRA